MSFKVSMSCYSLYWKKIWRIFDKILKFIFPILRKNICILENTIFYNYFSRFNWYYWKFCLNSWIIQNYALVKIYFRNYDKFFITLGIQSWNVN